MRTLARIAFLAFLTAALLFVPAIAQAEEYQEGTVIEEVVVEEVANGALDPNQVDPTATDPAAVDPTATDANTTNDQSGAQSTTDAEKKKKETPPPPKTYVVSYEPNGGDGYMPPTTFTEGKDSPLDRCTFTRPGYTFEGWNTMPDGSGESLADGVDVRPLLYDGLVLYAQWGSQIYLIRYTSGVPEKSDSPATGNMHSMLAVHDAEVALADCEYKRVGYKPKRWKDENGTNHDFGELGVNFTPETDTTSWELATIEANPPEEDVDGHWSCQGSVVYRADDGSLCAAMAFWYTSTAYKQGNMDAYDSIIKVVNLDTGEELKRAEGLMLEHANDIAYRPDNKHYYVAQGGIYEGMPDGIVELDENLNEVRTITPEGTHNIWNLSYSEGKFYAIGNVTGDAFARGNPNGETSDLIVLDKDLNLLNTYTVDYSAQGFSGQGMVCDGSFLYSILVNFGEHESKTKQRLAIFTLEGEPRGTMRIDIDSEVESASTVDGKMYFSNNGNNKGTIYGTNLACTTMSTVWEPNPYDIEFESNGIGASFSPDAIETTYDEVVALPDEEPLRPGYSFLGWNTKADGTGDTYMPGDSVHNLVTSGTATLYAQWKRAPFAFVADNGSKVDGTTEDARRMLGERPARAPRHMANIVALACACLCLAGLTRARPRPEGLRLSMG
ncbi:MAG: InlB B-repeat-containing protein [Atopobiaceae bacterium]|nr:InlB B-repeat-containing protein [Atopobiaceae bacterium]